MPRMLDLEMDRRRQLATASMRPRHECLGCEFWALHKSDALELLQ